MAFIEEQRRSRLPSVAAVVLIHVGIGYAFLSGLAFDVIKRGPDILQLIPLSDDPPPPPLERQPPPPAARQAATDPATVPDRIVTTASDPVVIDVQPLPPVLTRSETGPVIAPPPPADIAPAVRATAPRAVGDRGRWIATDDYPASSLRQGDEGSVGIAVRLGSDGRVKSCEVTSSSGHPTLDQATCRLYAARARFAPATENGQPVATTMRDRITWRLPR